MDINLDDKDNYCRMKTVVLKPGELSTGFIAATQRNIDLGLHEGKNTSAITASAICKRDWLLRPYLVDSKTRFRALAGFCM